MGTYNISVSREWDGHDRSVGRSIDYDSVGLAQARPNYATECQDRRMVLTETQVSSLLRYNAPLVLASPFCLYR